MRFVYSFLCQSDTLVDGKQSQPIRKWQGAENAHKKMKIEEIKKILTSKKGANLRAVWNRELKTKKGTAQKVEKLTRIIVRGGIEYDNMAVVQEGREDGTLPSENAGLPWGEWAEYPFHIQHKGTQYARFYPASGLEFIPETTYFIDGVEIKKQALLNMDICLKSEFPERDEAPLCYTIKADSVISLG